MRPALSILAMVLWAVACSRPAQPAAAPTAVGIEAVQIGNDGLAYLRETGNPFTGVVRVNHTEGPQQAELAFKAGRQHGRHREWFPDGKPSLEKEWVDGQEEGTQRTWTAEGRLHRESRWVAGKPVSGREWSPDGKKEWAISFTNGVMVDRKIARNESLTLPEEDRKYLWSIEHHGGLLMKLGFGPWKAALKKRERTAMNRALAVDFQAAIAPVDGGQNWVRDYGDAARAARTDFAAQDRRDTDASGFLEWLLGLRGNFGDTLDVGNSLASFAPVKRDQEVGRWGGLLHIRMWGKNTLGGPAELVVSLNIELDYPTEAALEKGGWLRRCSVASIKRSTSKAPLMAELAQQMGLQPDRMHDNWKHPPAKTISNTGGAFSCDFNLDGRIDLLITDPGLPRGFEFYLGEPGGKFKVATTEVGLQPGPNDHFFSQVAFADLDGDGWVDLVTNGGSVYRNVEGRRFENVTRQSNLPQLANLPKQWDATNFSVTDYDRDGQVDLYINHTDSSPMEGSWIDGKIGSKVANQLLRNVGGWHFDDVTAATGTDGGHRSTFAAVWLDADNNRWPDLYVINEYGNGVLLLNEGRGKPFRSVNLADFASDFGSMGLTAGDIDNDGHIDLYVASMYSKAGTRVFGNLRADAYPPDVMQKLRRMVAGSQLYRNAGGLKFEPMGAAWDLRSVGWAYAPALVDLDNDGFLDVLATAGFIGRDRSKPDG